MSIDSTTGVRLLAFQLIHRFTQAVLVVSMVAPRIAVAEVFGGIDFPDGAASFADAVVEYDPLFGGGPEPTVDTDPTKALGPPDSSASPALGSAACNCIPLGHGGQIVLRFTDNALTGSDTTDPDLHVFEVGSQLEDTFVDISRDGVMWHSVGKVFGATSSIDIDAFGFGANESFFFVRLTDDPNEGPSTGGSVGADIDAVGAIATVPLTFVAAVVDYEPLFGGGPVPTVDTDPSEALGPPDSAVSPDLGSAACSCISLGRGGRITLRWLGSALTGSDSPDPDLFVFEVGPDVEDTFVEVSEDGEVWHSVGFVFGGDSSVDIDSFGFGSDRAFPFVRLTDDPNEGASAGPSVGADIDAVGAVQVQPTPVPGISSFGLAVLSISLLLSASRLTRRCS